ncbi:MAG: cell division protein FtsX [Alphaproteobacteria bacterium]
MWRRANTDLPFDQDQSTRFLPWIVALMVLLAGLASAAVLIVHSAVATWDNGLTGRMTVQIPAESGDADAQRETVVTMLRATPGVVAAEPLDTAAIASLLEPWLGDAAHDADLPLPLLIDVQLAADARIDSTLLAQRLAEVAAGVAIDDHRVWLSGLIDLAHMVELVAIIVVVLIGLSAVATVVFATRSGFAVHYDIIELLHFMGARDSYVAAQFQGHAMRQGLRGGFMGALTAAALLAFIGFAARDIDAAFMPPLALSPWQWAILAIVPISAIAIAMATARLTVLRALIRMP